MKNGLKRFLYNYKGNEPMINFYIGSLFSSDNDEVTVKRRYDELRDIIDIIQSMDDSSTMPEGRRDYYITICKSGMEILSRDMERLRR